MICQECGAEVEVTEYHPHAFCVLIKAGLSPLTVISDAVRQLTTSFHKIYLQVKDEYGEPSGEVTWCGDRIHDTDAEYVLTWWEENDEMV